MEGRLGWKAGVLGSPRRARTGEPKRRYHRARDDCTRRSPRGDKRNAAHQGRLAGPEIGLTHHDRDNDDQRPATLWYRDPAVDTTSDHIYRGLSAFDRLTDEKEDALRKRTRTASDTCSS
jgi:hypothetical protein